MAWGPGGVAGAGAADGAGAGAWGALCAVAESTTASTPVVESASGRRMESMGKYKHGIAWANGGWAGLRAGGICGAGGAAWGKEVSLLR